MAIQPFDYIESQNDADELLAEFGQIGAIVRTEQGEAPNEWTPPAEATVYHPVTVALLPINEKDVTGALIKTGDQQALISPKGLTIEPTTTDVLLVNGAFTGADYVDGEAWTVVSVKTLAPAGLSVLHDLVVRR